VENALHPASMGRARAARDGVRTRCRMLSLAFSFSEDGPQIARRRWPTIFSLEAMSRFTRLARAIYWTTHEGTQLGRCGEDRQAHGLPLPGDAATRSREGPRYHRVRESSNNRRQGHRMIRPPASRQLTPRICRSTCGRLSALIALALHRADEADLHQR